MIRTIVVALALMVSDYSFHSYQAIHQMRQRCWDQFVRVTRLGVLVHEVPMGEDPRPLPEWLQPFSRERDEIDQLVDWSLQRGQNTGR